MLQRIGNQLGNLLKIDTRTINNVRGRYARLCVQIDLDSPLTSKVRIGSLLQPVQYEGIPTLCFKCGYVGHKAHSCPKIIQPSVPPSSTPHTSSSALDADPNIEDSKLFWILDDCPKL
nr:hypothetical protein CFP56_14083 [Quercus suber]